MLRFEAEPRREPEPEPSPAYGNDVFHAAMRALTLDRAARLARAEAHYAGAIPAKRITIDEARALFPAPRPPEPDPIEWARPDGMVTVAECRCEYCAAARLELAPPAIDRIMAGVDMPGRIVDDVRPDQRGE